MCTLCMTSSLYVHACILQCVVHVFVQYPWEIVKKAWEIGLLNGGIPQKFGGLGLGVLDESIIGEELSYGCTGISTAMLANGLAVRHLDFT